MDSSEFTGLVLCHAQGDRLAFPAAEVDSFGHATPEMPYAGEGFVPGSRAPEGAKALRCGASALVVDRLEIHALPTPRLPVPDALAHAWGGALICFVQCAGELWPVVSLRRLSAQPEVSS